MHGLSWLRQLLQPRVKPEAVCHGDRRQIQLDAGGMASLGRVVAAIRQRGGYGAFYAGFLPNALKNLPNKGMLSYGHAWVGKRPAVQCLWRVWFKRCVSMPVRCAQADSQVISCLIQLGPAMASVQLAGSACACAGIGRGCSQGHACRHRHVQSN